MNAYTICVQNFKLLYVFKILNELSLEEYYWTSSISMILLELYSLKYLKSFELNKTLNCLLLNLGLFSLCL